MTSSRFSRSFGSHESNRKQSNREQEQPASARRPADDESQTAAEVILSSESGTVQGVCERTLPAVRPCGVFVPENYEPNYAYPLIIWLHEAGHCERDIVDVLPKISMRNYIGLSLRGTAPAAPGEVQRKKASPGFSWSRSERKRLAFQEALYASVRQLRKDFHIHTERVFLAGAGEGASLAWELFLARPEWFAGLAVFGGHFPWRRRPLRHYRKLRAKRVFLAADVHDDSGLSRAEQVGRLLYTSGLEVAVRCQLPGGSRRPSLFRQIDHWIMESIGGCL